MEFVVALAQVDAHVGALAENLKKILATARRAREAGACLVVFPELVLTGYPPEDLLHKPLFLDRLAETERELHRELGRIGIDAVYGSVRRGADGLFNAGIFVQEGRETGFAAKWRLPNHSVFDERRYFEPFNAVRAFPYRGVPFGITICEDIWHPGGPMARLAATEAAFIINLNASPYHVGKQRQREGMVAQRITESGLPVLYVNLVGGQDELVYDGASFAMNRDGVPALRCRLFEEDLRLLTVHRPPGEPVRFRPGSGEGEPVTALPGLEREVYAALCLGLRDYVHKNGFSGVVLGLSGGIDSALTATICADALGPERVTCLMMPSRYTSPESLEDAADGARRLGVALSEIAIDTLFDRFRQELADSFRGLGEDVTEENIQPRIRATLLMALANKKGLLLVTTGNKSEVSVGYATLYGDMAGGYSVLKDVLKDLVYRLARARNQWAAAAGKPPPVPQRVIDKAPSAELRPDQRDSDSLPPYPILDRILELYVEREYGLQEIVDRGIDRETAVRVIRLVDRNEYKRRQAPPGVRITARAFGKDRRYPITNGFRVT